MESSSNFYSDTNLVSTGHSLTHLEQQIKEDIPLLINWLHTNRFSLNLTKTHFMIFGSKNKFPHPITIQIEGENIAEVEETKFLGVILDSSLSWKKHIYHISKKSLKASASYKKPALC
jgi:hypothetical protein